MFDMIVDLVPEYKGYGALYISHASIENYKHNDTTSSSAEDGFAIPEFLPFRPQVNKENSLLVNLYHPFLFRAVDDKHINSEFIKVLQVQELGEIADTNISSNPEIGSAVDLITSNKILQTALLSFIPEQTVSENYNTFNNVYPCVPSAIASGAGTDTDNFYVDGTTMRLLDFQSTDICTFLGELADEPTEYTAGVNVAYYNIALGLLYVNIAGVITAYPANHYHSYIYPNMASTKDQKDLFRLKLTNNIKPGDYYLANIVTVSNNKVASSKNRIANIEKAVQVTINNLRKIDGDDTTINSLKNPIGKEEVTI